LSNDAVAQRHFTTSLEKELLRAPKGLTDAMITRMLGTYVDLLQASENVLEGAGLELN